MSANESTEGLIAVPEGVTSGWLRRACAWIAFIVFLVTTVGSGFTDALFPMKAPILIGAEKIADDKRRANAALSDGTLTRLFEHDLRLTSRVRRTVSPHYSLTLYHWFRQADPRVLVGQGDWLFMTTRATPPRRPDSEVAGVGACLLSAVDRRVAGVGVQLVMALVPRKAVVHGDLLPADHDARPAIDALLIEGLVERGVTTARIDRAFDAVKDEWLYFQADGHWTERAEREAAEAIADAGGFLVPAAERSGSLHQSGMAAPDRNTLRYLGLELGSGALRRVELEPVPVYDVFDEGGRIVKRSKPAQMTRIAVAGTSFTARRKLAHFLSYFAQEPVFNAAKQGVSLMANVRDFFAEHGDELPEALVLELPVHQLFTIRGTTTARLPRHAGSFFADTPPPGVSIVTPVEVHEDARPPTTGRKRLAALRTGSVAHTGDGVLALRVRGRVRGKPAILELHVGKVNVEIPWRPRQKELVIPLMSHGTTSANIVLQARPTAPDQLTIESIELVTELDREGGVAAVPEAPVGRAGGWSQELTLPARTTVPTLGGLLVQLSEDARPAADLEIEVSVEGSGVRRFPLSGMREGAWIVLNLAGLAGGRVEGLRLSASGPVPNTAVQSAALLPAQPARER